MTAVNQTQPSSVPAHRSVGAGAGRDAMTGRLLAMAWRNLWRNRRRTWFTVGGVAFAVWFLVFAKSMQIGAFDTMIDNGAKMFTGHLQVQARGYADEPRVDRVMDVRAALQHFAQSAGLRHVSARAQGFALASAGERSFGAQVIGVEPRVEAQWSTLAAMPNAGRFLQQPGESYIGAALARNLGLQVGDELVLLGTALEGGIAALGTTVVGTFESSNPALDRAIVQVHLASFRQAWNMTPDQAHMLVGLSRSVQASETDVALARRGLAGYQDIAVLDWTELMPEASQTRELKLMSMQMMFAVIAVIVVFSVVNTFMMTVFERTPEMGVLAAIGMRASQLQGLLQLEALLLSLVGISLGIVLTVFIVGITASTGIELPIPEDAREFYERFNMGTHIYPAFDWSALLLASATMLAGVQLAALIPGLRLRRMRPVEAIRQAA